MNNFWNEKQNESNSPKLNASSERISQHRMHVSSDLSVTERPSLNGNTLCAITTPLLQSHWMISDIAFTKTIKLTVTEDTSLASCTIEQTPSDLSVTERPPPQHLHHRNISSTEWMNILKKCWQKIYHSPQLKTSLSIACTSQVTFP